MDIARYVSFVLLDRMDALDGRMDSTQFQVYLEEPGRLAQL